ncbi:MAG: DNA alkylation repair protein [Patescibacteria group bacterium]
MICPKIANELNKIADKKQAVHLRRFFKTGKGQYGEGDKFLGIKVPRQREVAKKYFQEITLEDVKKLIASPYHEFRLTGLIILTYKFPKISEADQKKIFDFYLKHTKRINNWDLVDLSAPNIVGTWLLDKNRKILYKLAKSRILWERRIAMLATYAFIRAGEFDDTLKLADILLNDKHDLMHKAVGWMLREVGKRDKKVLTNYLKPRYKNMPRTMLRYAIEKFSEGERKFYLSK